jgi:hypothetical protein
MTRGGARVNAGRKPDPNALRRDRPGDAETWTLLPASGRKGRVPPWPLDGDPDAREWELWRVLWKLPQAEQWDRLAAHHSVAVYVRLFTLTEQGDLKAASEARQWSDRLGLNPAAMRQQRWKVEPAEAQPRPPTKPSTQSSRSRFEVVQGGANPA